MLSSNSLRAETSLAEIVRDDLAFATTQYDLLLRHIAGQAGFPRSWEKGNVVLAPASDWTSGFLGGSLWYLFEATGERKWRDAAHAYTAPLESNKHDRGTHDVGFVLYCSFGHGWRLTHHPAYREILLEGARSLSTRFNPVVGCIKSWDWAPQWTFPVIIDNMMNLELLTWAARESGESALRDIAVSHANTTLRHHFRADASCCHVVDYDVNTGAVRERVTHQGLADDSAWARGQAWALYGYTMMYRETHLPAYLAHAARVAEFILQHPRLPADKVPYWDFDAPITPETPRDSSAAAIISSGLLELSEFVSPEQASRYRAVAHQQLRALSSPAYRAPLGENGCFLLQHATGHMPNRSEVDAPLNYGDYYFLEALLRARRQLRE